MATSLFQSLGSLAQDAGQAVQNNRAFDLKAEDVHSEIAKRAADITTAKSYADIAQRQQQMNEIAHSVPVIDQETRALKGYYNPVTGKMINISDLPPGWNLSPGFEPGKDPITAGRKYMDALKQLDVPPEQAKALLPKLIYSLQTGHNPPQHITKLPPSPDQGSATGWSTRVVDENMEQIGPSFPVAPPASTVGTQSVSVAVDPVTGLKTTTTTDRKKVPGSPSGGKPSVQQALARGGAITPPTAPSSAPVKAPATSTDGGTPTSASSSLDYKRLPATSRAVVEQTGNDLVNGKITIDGVNTKFAKSIWAKLIPDITAYAENKGWSPVPLKDAASMNSLNLLSNSLYGTKLPNGEVDPNNKGLADYLDVLDNDASRMKITGFLRYAEADKPHSGNGLKAAMAGMIETELYKGLLTPQEAGFLNQYRRAVSAIQSLRAFTGNPRSSESTIMRYVQELVDPKATQGSEDARQKLQLIRNEINALTKPPGAQGAQPTAPSAGTPQTADDYFKKKGLPH